MAPDPDASCLTCRKRQVKCDGNRPTCGRCPKDERECRGYKGQLRIVQVNPVKSNTSTQQKPKVARGAIAVSKFPLVKHIFISDRDLWTLVDCANYWNNNIIPSTFPAERPFFRHFIMGNEIAIQPMPKICLHFVIVAFRAAQAAKLLIDPFTQPDLCYYRGLGLRALPEHLEHATTDPHGVALMSVVMLMTSDLAAPDGSWLVHLDAARRIVDLRGGIGACIRSLPDAIFVVVQLYLIDTLTSAVCDSVLLPETSLADTIGYIPNIDFQLIACASTCPVEILQVIARISSLRRHKRDGDMPCHRSDSPMAFAEYDTLLSDLTSFDCTAWATRIAHMGLSYPITVSNVTPCSSMEGLARVAECFRSAALVYLLLSCTASIDKDTIQRARRACNIVYTEVDAIFDKASRDCNKPLDTQLWKFVTWPLIVASYAWVGWRTKVVEGRHLETTFYRLRLIAGAREIFCRLSAEAHLREIVARRAERPGVAWTWDMGFVERRAFVL